MTLSTDVALRAPEVHVNCAAEVRAKLPGIRFQGIPGVACTTGGTLWATWYGGGTDEGPDNYVMLTNRPAGGERWREPWLIVRSPFAGVRTFDPTLWVDPDGRLWLFWAQSQSPQGKRGIWDGRGGVWGICCQSPDEQPQRWSEPRRFCDGVMMNKPTVDGLGRWLMPVSVWDMQPRIEGVQRGPTVAVVTGEQVRLGGVARVVDCTYDEHHVMEVEAGQWRMWIRTANLDYAAAVSESTDEGRTWSEAAWSNVPCPNSRFYVGRLKSGAILMVSHAITTEVRAERKTWPTRSHLTAWVSDDRGQTWTGGLLIDERTGVSYPDVAQDDHGTIHVIYDRDRYGAGEILLASVSEPEIRGGGVLGRVSQVVTRMR